MHGSDQLDGPVIDVGRRRYERIVGFTIVVLVAVRLAVAATCPLAFDEAYYWRLSQHLAFGYIDHPPVVMALIHVGASLFGDTELGIRILNVLLGLPATWAVWRSATILFDREIGATAALYFNLTLVMAVGSILFTPDSPLVLAASFLLFCLAKLHQTGRGGWWIAAGLVFGLGMLAKYSMLFLAVSMLIWVTAVPELRRWLFTPWPWAGGIVAALTILPNLIWNAEHDWASIRYQSERLVPGHLSLEFVAPFVGSQIGLAAISVFTLGMMGLIGLARQQKFYRASSVVLLNAMFWPIMLYFLWHSFHGRVEGNWPEPAYPAFSIVAAVAADRLQWHGLWQWTATWSRRLAVVTGLTIAAVIYLQGVFGLVPMGRTDPTARALGAGWRELGTQIDDIRKRTGARLILAFDYGLVSWLSFYVPSRPAIQEIAGRMRWINEPAFDPALAKGPVLYVCEVPCSGSAKSYTSEYFEAAELIATLPRARKGVMIEQYEIYRLERPRGPVLYPVVRMRH